MDETKAPSVSTGRSNLVGITLAALCAALIAVGTFISIPVPMSPVPIVLQNMFAILAGLLLGPLWGGIAVALYLVIGALGAPVFAGAKGGMAIILGPTGGYLLGYLLAAIVGGLIAGTPQAGKKTPLWRLAIATGVAILVIYVPGLLRLNMVYEGNWTKTFATGFLPFIIGDILKGIVAALVSLRVRSTVGDLYQSA